MTTTPTYSITESLPSLVIKARERKIRKVAVLGSGVMGSQIALHFANTGLEVLLLDIVPKQLSDAETAKGLTEASPAFRNRIVTDAFTSALKLSPNPAYSSGSAKLITLGNFTDNLADIATADWVIEVVIENLEIKRSLFAQVDTLRQKGTLITSNTSGIPINLMAEGRSEDFKRNFCGSHFFNPPRYLQLLEIIPTKDTDPEVIQFLMHYGDLHLGKTTVQCFDTPAFIANRLGVFAIMDIFRLMPELGLSIEDIDKLTGPVIGHPKSATFRTSDVVGLDTLIKVADNLYNTLDKDEAKEVFKLPGFLGTMQANKWLGEKTKQGFYKKVTVADGKKQILSLNLTTMEYALGKAQKFSTLEATKSIDNLKDRFKVLIAGKDVAGAFYRQMLSGIFSYASHRLGEIADKIYKMDDAIKAGFGWEMGIFETWDSIGLENGVAMLTAEGKTVAPWVKAMIAKGNKTFYKIDGGKKLYYDTDSEAYQAIPGAEDFIILDAIRPNKIWANTGTTLHNLGDGVLGLEFHTKMNTIGSDVIEGLNKAINLAEKGWNGLVIGNQGGNFSAGANLAMVLMYALEQEYDELDMMIRQFQQTIMRVRYSSIPVVVAPHGLTLGGGCEMTLHADRVQAAAETYIGLVEVGVGVIPGGGGTKEMALRVADSYEAGDTEINTLTNAFMAIATAKVSTSATEAFNMHYLRKNADAVTLNKNRQIFDAKQQVLTLASEGYRQAAQRKDIKVLGKTALATLMIGINGMRMGGYISDHDVKVAGKLAYTICGGDLSSPTLVTEQYLLDLERESFLSLCTERKTLERIQSILTTGKPLRN